MSLDYQCPLCQQTLTLQTNVLKCSNNHSFDTAKEGYVNLLPVQQKNSKHPGDNLDMVQARRAFLATGHYQFLQTAIAQRVATHRPQYVIDLGCGEGFYTQAIANACDAKVYGVDISKSAIKFAAKRYKHCNFSVASISQAPFNDGMADVLVSIFAPLFDAELARLAKSDGTLIVASPGPWHLKELKHYIYRDVNAHTAISVPDGFELIEQTLLEQQISLPFNDVKNLITMTPFAWKFRPEHWQQLEQQGEQVVTLSFYVSQFTRLTDSL
ncbi:MULTISPECIES: 23S rRNA (guanine(745)-N(1))-methyltransferase [Pseudoalteromonas]|uniref:23S rRNA (Guanine(745)-N(1))-methyltransferase n=1 Tax=Pseudoalteromonas haloplanktis TaxID=228 RepID=A0ABU1B981_PSEHA|nr:MULTISPECIES: 23S rRNA (guanine(745)-N(1))-methyltransferase [Pseudoalteromonas]MCF6142712.1 23S rRNA (guanine745-N1)-methyltransferase [Pseudoalteromonas mariniglutinosa NCIMB 1770]MDQ9090905.1 23S rRNA (guanine(745)-N(1))-methyltransferase [Pseudoalteromonas haloplanktis]BDF94538.1 23S rRNA (guanine(745)-N(1))-methyltransferase [Pseudoalteromonas sp. KAN5]